MATSGSTFVCGRHEDGDPATFCFFVIGQVGCRECFGAPRERKHAKRGVECSKVAQPAALRCHDDVRARHNSGSAAAQQVAHVGWGSLETQHARKSKGTLGASWIMSCWFRKKRFLLRAIVQNKSQSRLAFGGCSMHMAPHTYAGVGHSGVCSRWCVVVLLALKLVAPSIKFRSSRGDFVLRHTLPC